MKNLTREELKEIYKKSFITEEQIEELSKTGKTDLTEEQKNNFIKLNDYFVNDAKFVSESQVDTLLQICQHFLNQEQLKVLNTIICFLD